jgi:hypothetical protein
MGITWTISKKNAATSSETLVTNYQPTVPPWTALKVGAEKCFETSEIKYQSTRHSKTLQFSPVAL